MTGDAGAKDQASALNWRDRVPGGRPFAVQADGKTVQLVVNRPSDFVMKEHQAGRFAFPDLLDLLARVVISGTRVLDIGAGFGNTTIYAAAILGAREVVAIEPYPEAADVLRANVELNRLEHVVDTSLLGVAFADAPGMARADLPYKTHIGGVRLVPDDAGSVSVVRGDDRIGDRDFDVVILDINGREVAALAGLSHLLERCRPMLVVSAIPNTRDRLTSFLQRRGYNEISSIDLHDGKQSFLLFRPREEQAVRPDHVSHRQGLISTWEQNGTTLRFFVSNRGDSIQSCHFMGHLYEVEELAIIARHVPSGARVLDCGSNVGNHAVAFAKLLGASRIVAIEPNPTAFELLRINCALNGLAEVDLSYLGVALSDHDGTCRLGDEPIDNLGGTVIVPGEAGDVRMMRGDDLLSAQTFDFIKIDVEGSEIAVLEGLRETILRDRPVLFVEVGDERVEDFARFLASCDYQVEDGYRRYARLINLVAKPKPPIASPPPSGPSSNDAPKLPNLNGSGSHDDADA